MSVDIFISAGRPFNDSQEEFLCALEDYLRANGLNPRAVGRNEFAHKNPLKFIEQLMRECTATIVVAFERVHVDHGVERRGSTNETVLECENMSTAWNQVEAAMAYTIGHPLFVIVENGCRTDGLLESGYDWYVQRLDMSREALTGKEFVGRFNNWKTEIVETAKQKPLADARAATDVDKMTLAHLFSALRLSHLFTLVALTIAYTGLVVTLVTKFLGK